MSPFKAADVSHFASQDLAMSHDLIMAAVGMNQPIQCIIWLGLHGDDCEWGFLATPWDRSQAWLTDPSVRPAVVEGPFEGNLDDDDKVYFPCC